jgi:SAM-dependent methyltransferase
MPKQARYTLAQSSNFIPITAMVYDLWRERSLSLLTGESYPLKREYALMLEWLNVQPGQVFLDVGTSTGNYARALSDAGANVTAIDISRPMLEKAASRSEGYDTINYEQVNVEALPYPDSSFDGVVVGASLNEFHDTARALREMTRVLRPTGKLFVMYLRRADTSLGRFSQLPFTLLGVRFPDRDHLKRQLLELGFTCTRAEVRRAIALELYTPTASRSEASFENHLQLTRNPGKPAKEPLY